ncbi:MAG: aromatic ring-hydroxylating dioxygenase subunit alpha [Coleofasciculaceae cyanobacterium]
MVSNSVLVNDWHPLMLSQDLKEGRVKSKRLLGEDLVLWRYQNQITVCLDLCPHRGARLSLGRVEDGSLVCPYHGLKFNQQGKCIQIPVAPNLVPSTRTYLHTYVAQDYYGLVWVSLGNPVQSIPDFGEWHKPSYRPVFCGPYHCNSSAFRLVENFLDVAHFPFVHADLLGDPINPTVDEYEVEIGADGISFYKVSVWQPNPDGTGQAGLVAYNYRILRPLTAYFSKDTPSGCLTIFFTVTPVEEEECIAWMWMARNYDCDVSEAEQRAFQDQIVTQDLPIVESQRPKRLPLDLQAEYHLPCDKGAIAYRKWLKQLGITFGTL